MSSDVQICNRGLSWVGLKQITSLTGDEAEAEQCNLHYSDNLALLLSMYPWSFATARVTLAELTNDRTKEWLYKYQRPTNSLRILWVNDPAVSRTQLLLGKLPTAPYELVSDKIYSDVKNAVCEHTTLIEDASLLPIYFQSALSWMVARDVVISMTEDSKRLEFAENKMMAAVEKAMSEDAGLEVQIDTQFPSWITNRGATDFQMQGYNIEGIRNYFSKA